MAGTSSNKTVILDQVEMCIRMLTAELVNAVYEALKEQSDEVSSIVGAYTWYIDTDEVKDLEGTSYGTMEECQTDKFVGKWFYLCTTDSRAGSGPYPSKYTIAGANGNVSYGDYVMWTGSRLVHISINEAKSSDVKNSDGKYSSTGGVDGLMSSTDKAYLSDLITQHWGKGYIPVRHCKDSADTNMRSGWLVNWCREDGWYVGGLGVDCVNHPPYTGDNKVNWLLLVVNGMRGAESENYYNLRVQVALDVKNSLIYMRRGWISNNDWATDGEDGWTRVGGAAGEKNQNAFSNIMVGSVKVEAETPTDTLTLKAGTNVTLSADTTNDTVTIEAKDTTYPAADGNTLGTVKSGGDATISNGVITVSGKAPETHTHKKADITDFPNSMTPTAHAVSATTYGAGSGSNYGHVKLSDSTGLTSGVSGGTAATPTAVKAAYDLANKASTNIGNLSGLSTSAKTTVVAAINELKSAIDEFRNGENIAY